MKFLIALLSGLLGALALFMFGKKSGEKESKAEVIQDINQKIHEDIAKNEILKEKIHEEIENTDLNDLVNLANKKYKGK